MPEKPANQDLSESTSSQAEAVKNQLEKIYEERMDTMLLYIGRDVTFYLEPGRTPTSVNPDHYDPFTGGQDRRLGNANTGNKGYTVEPIWVVYKAQIVHGPKPILDEKDGIQFELEVGDVQLTTVYGAWDDIKQAVEVEVDGIKFTQKDVDPRPIGLSSPKYIMSVWTKKTPKA